MANKNNPFITLNERTKAFENPPVFDDVYKQTKSFDFSPWGGIEGFLEASKSGQTGYNQKGSQYRIVVPDIFRAVDMTSVAISSLPFDIMRGDAVIDSSSDWQNALGGIQNPQRLIYNLASSLCGGSAYIIPEMVSNLISDLRYIPPGTITFDWDTGGIRKYYYNSQFGASLTFEPDDLVTFFFPDSDVEQGPAKAHPLGVAMAAAQREFAMNNTININAERGFIAPTLLMVQGMVNKTDREATEAWWNSWLKRAFTQVAKIINAEKMSIQKVGAGMDELKTVFVELKRDAKEEVGQAFGIPAALFMSDKAYASEYDALIRMWYSTSTFVTIYQTIQETFTEQVFDKFDGAYMIFKPETIDAFQEDETKKAAAFREYASARIRPSIVAQMLGLEMPQGIDYRMLDEDFDKPKPVPPVNPISNPEQPPTATTTQTPAPKMPEMQMQNKAFTLTVPMLKDLESWSERAIAWHKKGKSAVDWECKALPEELAETIRARLRVATNEYEIAKAFEFGGHNSDHAILTLADAINQAVKLERDIK